MLLYFKTVICGLTFWAVNLLSNNRFYLGAVQKRRPQPGGCTLRAFCGQEGILQMRKSALFDAKYKKLRNFRNL